MLSSFATVPNSSSSSPYENSSSWWKLNFTTSSCAALASALFPSSSTPLNEEISTTTNHHAYTNGFIHHDDEPLRILIFAESFPSFTSGITRRFKEIIRRLAKRRHHIHVITGCANAMTWVEGNELEGSVTFSIHRSAEFTNKIDCACPFLLPSPWFYSSIRRFAPDMIHIVEQTPGAMLCGAFAKSLNIPIVWSSHTNIDFYLSTYIRPSAVKLTQGIYQFIRLQQLKDSAMNLTVSQDFAAFMEHTGVPKPVRVWKTGVDSELFNPTRRSRSMRYRMFGPHNHYSEEQMNNITLFLCVGRISPEKNFEFLSLVLDRISSQTFLCIVGDGPYRTALEPIFPRDRVYFLGYLGGEELASAYASADYFIYASVSETFGQVYLEAMASGTPVVAAEGGQLKEFFINGEHGYLWKPDDLDSAEQAIRTAMTDRHYLSMKARQQALKHSWDSASDQLNEIYVDVFHQRKKEKKNNQLNPFVHTARLIYYGFNWIFCILLALLLMAPFVQVSSPKSTVNQQQMKNSGHKQRANMTENNSMSSS